MKSSVSAENVLSNSGVFGESFSKTLSLKSRLQVRSAWMTLHLKRGKFS